MACAYYLVSDLSWIRISDIFVLWESFSSDAFPESKIKLEILEQREWARPLTSRSQEVITVDTQQSTQFKIGSELDMPELSFY
jgi:hypothetical protein